MRALEPDSPSRSPRRPYSVTLARFVKEMVLEIDYANFKHAVARERLII